MPKKYTVEFELKGTGTDAEKAIKGVSGEVDKLGKSAKTAAKGGLKDADKAGGSLSKTFTSLKTPITAAITALVGLGSLNGIRLLAKDARDLDNAAQSLGIGVNTLSQYQYAFQQLNIDGSKTVDMFKDINERVGEFANTGGGELADIIKRTNLNIRELKTLSPDQQLLKIYNALEKIDGITKAEINAYLKQLVSDAAILQPLLANGAAELKRFAAEGEALGVTLDAIEVEKLRQADEELRKFSATWSGFTNDLSISFLPILNKLIGGWGLVAAGLSDARTKTDELKDSTDTNKVSFQTVETAINDTKVAMHEYINKGVEGRAEIKKGISARIIETQSYIELQRAALEAAVAKDIAARNDFSFFDNEEAEAKRYAATVDKLTGSIATGITKLNELRTMRDNLGDPSKLPALPQSPLNRATFGQSTNANTPAKTSAQKIALIELTEAREADIQAIKEALKAQDELDQQAQLVTDTWRAHTAELERERFVLGKTTDEIYAYDLAQETVGKSKAKWTEEEIRWLVEFRKGTTARMRANEEQAKAQDLLNQKTEDSIRLQHEFADIIDNELSSSLSRLVDTGVPLLDKLINKFIEAAIEGRDLSSILGGGFGGGGGIAGFVSSLFGGGGSSYSPINAAGSSSGFSLNLPTFADGGTHSGGLRIVGENGPELEYTGPSQILNNASTSKLLNSPASNGSGVSLKVETHLHEDASKAGQVQQRSGADGKQIIDVFVSNIRSGGAAASALESSYLLKRQGR